MSREVRVPAGLHEVLGKYQTRWQIALIAAAGVAITTLTVVRAFTLNDFAGLPWWRGALAILIVFDVAAGCVANLTPGTSNYYAARPRLRYLFYSVHIHLIALAALLGVGFWSAVAVTAYTVAASLFVNALPVRQSQLLLAGVTFVTGVSLQLTMLSGLPLVLRVTAVLFLFKLVLSFSVDHYGAGSRVDETEGRV